VSLDVAVAQFDGEGTAVRRYAAAREVPGADPPWTHKVGFVEHHRNGRLLLRGTFAGHYLDVDEGDRVSQKGAGEGAVAGGLAGALLGPAGFALGLTLGTVLGSRASQASEVEDEPEALAGQLRVAVPRSSSAIVLIAEPPDVDEMVASLDKGAQGITREALTVEQQAALEESLSMAPPVSPEL
jgi:uncharacterized membrane protein